MCLADDWQKQGAKLLTSSLAEFVLSLDFRFVSNGSISVYVQPRGKQPPTYCIRYVPTSTTLDHVGDSDIIIGIGDRSHWTHLTRDVSIDFQKGLSEIYSRRKQERPRLFMRKLVAVVFRGHVLVDNVTLSSSAHLAPFYYAANWLVLHQDERGGWPINVRRRINKHLPELAPGWYSAMAQGQAMSLLVRAYVRTQNSKYLDAALRATELLAVPSDEGGVRAQFADKFAWYEEYPTQPGSFVLNGFIYSLIGLYDLKTIAPASRSAQAQALLKDGMTSLVTLLPLFDTGSGSTYDLRHVGLHSAPNLARWDYHATHINQLLLLATIVDDPVAKRLFQETAERWIGYTKGRRASHN